MHVKKLSKMEQNLLDEQNQGRKNLGLPLLKTRVRRCIKCKSYFESVHKRFCGCRWTGSISVLSGMEVV
ncbi:MAG: hypothetical protein HRU09_20765 [Oligoflexales bacterium]|nr:hypothetical protein [Oligoflexales bacterium]